MNVPNSLSKKSDINQFKCSSCNRYYTQKSALNRHKRDHHSENPGKPCKFCGKKTIRYYDHERRCKLKELTKIQNENNIYKGAVYFNIYNKENCLKNDLKNFLDNLPEKIKFSELIDNFALYKNILIGKGGSMKVFYGYSMDMDCEVAIKFAIKKNSLLCESFVLEQLKDLKNVPKIYKLISEDKKYFLIQDLFGPSLKEILSYYKDNFDVWTICEIGVQIIQLLYELHSKNFIHNDIKPGNICWGRIYRGNFLDKDKLFLIDYSMARKINSYNDNSITNIDIFNQKISLDLSTKNKKYEGTPKYMAIRKGKGKPGNKQTDLEELFYSLIYLFKGQFPWKELPEEDHIKYCIRLNKKKSSVKITELCDGLPEEFIVLGHYIFSIKEDEEPCYETIKQLLNICKQKYLKKEYSIKEFCFNRYVKEKFNKYKNKEIFDSSNDEIKMLFGEIPLNKDSLIV